MLYHTGIGDGNYPVSKARGFYKVTINYPLLHDRLDKERLAGEFLGYSIVDSGMQCIVDKSWMQVKPDVSKDAYTVMPLENGIYTCRFDTKNDSVLIKRNGRTK